MVGQLPAKRLGSVGALFAFLATGSGRPDPTKGERMVSLLDNRMPEGQSLARIKAAADLLYLSYSKDSERYRLVKEALAASTSSQRQAREADLADASQACGNGWDVLQDLVAAVERELPNLAKRLRLVRSDGLAADGGIPWHERQQFDWDSACNEFQQIVETTRILLNATTPLAGEAKQGEGRGGADTDKEISALEAATPPLDRESGKWVRNKRAAQIEGVETRTLADYRLSGVKNAAGTLGRDKDGRVWRREGTPHAHPWYLRSTLLAK